MEDWIDFDNIELRNFHLRTSVLPDLLVVQWFDIVQLHRSEQTDEVAAKPVPRRRSSISTRMRYIIWPERE